MKISWWWSLERTTVNILRELPALNVDENTWVSNKAVCIHLFSKNPYSYKDQLHWALANSVFIMLMSRFWSQFQMTWNLSATFSSLPQGSSSELRHRHTQESLADLTAPSPTHNAECQAGLLWYQPVSSTQQPQVYPRCYKHAESEELV